MLEGFIDTTRHAFLAVSVKDLLDIGIVAAIVYFILVFVKETRSFFIFSTVFVFSVVAYLANIFELSLTKTILAPFLTFIFLIIIVVFQKEIRRFFEWFSLAGRGFARKRGKLNPGLGSLVRETVETLIKRKFGAIIVLPGDHPVEHSIDGGIPLSGEPSLPLLLSIFDPHTPGHDGAVIISEGKITFFGAHLPLANKFSNSLTSGTRHRAALGLSLETDALIIVVSEERGAVSLAQNGRLKEVSREEFERRVEGFLKEHAQEINIRRDWKYFIIKNYWEKIAALSISVLLWLTVIR